MSALPKAVYTEGDARAHVAEHMEPIMRNFHASKKVPYFLKGESAIGLRMREVWQAGCWLNDRIREHGGSEMEVYRIGFAHGQRSLFGDPWAVAVEYVNHWVAFGRAKEQPGCELADRINAEVFS